MIMQVFFTIIRASLSRLKFMHIESRLWGLAVTGVGYCAKAKESGQFPNSLSLAMPQNAPTCPRQWRLQSVTRPGRLPDLRKPCA